MNATFKTVAVLSLTLFSGGCTKRSFEQRIAVMCDAPNHVNRAGDPVAKATELGKILEEAAKDNAEAKQLVDSLMNMEPREKAATLRAAANKAGIAKCPMADLMEPVPTAQ